MVHKLVFVCFLFIALQSKAQNNFYFVGFKQKDTSHFLQLKPENYLTKEAINRRKKYNLPILSISDIPVNQHYTNKILPYINTFYFSVKWLNGIVVLGNENLADSLKQFNFVSKVTLIGFDNLGNKKESINLAERINLLEHKFDKTTIIDSNLYYGEASEAIYFNQIQKLHQKNCKAQNITIAVLDGGFYKLDKLPFFNSAPIKGTYNLANSEISIYDTENDDHGLNVFSLLAANKPYQYVGAAPMANYYLFNTENSFFEYPIEEYYWAKAAEMADSLGVDIITTSLGYTEFDDKQFGYKPKDMNGHKTIIAQAANMAASKGILVISSAGNEGDKLWETISSPADADSVLAIGACNNQNKVSAFSSVGFAKRNKIKPNLVTLGQGVSYINWQGKIVTGNGTSYSTPLMAGAAACLMGAFPTKTPFEIKQALSLSASNYNDANKNLGYGIPNVNLSYNLLENYQCDTLIQITELLDNNLHICLNSELNQKIEITLQSADEKVVFKQKQKVLFGINRFELSKSFKVKQGLYIVKIKMASTILIKQIEKH